MQYGYDPSCAPGDAPCAPARTETHRAARGGGATVGVVLIVLGAAFLAAQFVPGIRWWTLWPLGIVVLGLVQVVTPGHAQGWGIERVADGMGTMLFGLLLLGNTTGYVSWSVWLTLLSLWPVLLISGGIALLGTASGQEWLRALASIPIWITILYAAGLAWTGAPLPVDLMPLPFTFEMTPFPPFR